MSADLAAIGRQIVDANLYMTLATADESGRPWASPVYYAADGYRDFYWVSGPQSRHSLNLAVRPEVAIVIFDSSVPINTGRAVYLEGSARLVEGEEAERGIAVFSRRSQDHGGDTFTMTDVQSPAHLRLYRASISRQSVTDSDADHDERAPVVLG